MKIISPTEVVKQFVNSNVFNYGPMVVLISNYGEFFTLKLVQGVCCIKHIINHLETTYDLQIIFKSMDRSKDTISIHEIFYASSSFKI